MLETFFFIPASNEKFINNVSRIRADNFIFDFEDSVKPIDFQNCLENISKIEAMDNYYLRYPFYNNNNGSLRKLIKLGFKKFILPKIFTIDELDRIRNLFQKFIGKNKNDYSFILLVENPLCLVNLNELLKNNDLNLIGIGLGSHDYSNIIGMKHTLDHLSYARNHVLNMGKAYDLCTIDIASMNINDEQGFEEECLDAFNLGYDGKFILHPKQINLLNEVEYFSYEEINEANKVYSDISKISDNSEALVYVDGKIYEKAHIKRIKKIINWARKKG